jgi:hypothetical protein
MSATIVQALPTTLIVDPVCDYQTEVVYAVEKSVSNLNFYVIKSNNTSSVSTSWTINCNSNETLTNRLFLQVHDFSLTIPHLGNAADLPANCNFALRAFPLLAFSKNYVLSVGNANTTIESGQLYPVLTRFGLMDKWINYSSSPNYCDVTAPYSAGGQWSPFNNATQASGENQFARGSYAPVSIVKTADQGINRTIIRYVVIEPVWMSPLVQSLKDRVPAFQKLSQINLTVNWGNVCRLFCADSQIAASGVTVTMNSSELRVQQMVPSLLDVGRELSTLTLPYNEFNVFSTDPVNMNLRGNSTIRPGDLAGVEFQSSVLQLSRIPKELYIWVQPSTNSYAINDGTVNAGYMIPDTFATYVSNSLKVNFNGQNLLTNASAIDLYSFQAQNGINVPFSSWTSNLLTSKPFALNGAGVYAPEYAAGVGSPICLKFSQGQIVLASDLAPGCLTKCNLQISASFYAAAPITAGTPFNGATLPYQMFIAINYEGAMQLYGSNVVSTTIGCLTTEDVLTAVKRNERIHYDIVNDKTLGGANVLSRAMSFLREQKYKPYIEKFKKIIEHPLYKEASKTVKQHLRGTKKMAEGHYGPEEQGQSHLADIADSLGLGMVGGRKMTKAEMKRMLMQG